MSVEYYLLERGAEIIVKSFPTVKTASYKIPPTSRTLTSPTVDFFLYKKT